MQIETLRSLREIAAAATGADRELDGDLFNVARCELPQTTRHVSAWVCHGHYYKRTLFDGRGEPDSTDVFHVPSYTSSLDAAVALVERMLPGWHWEVNKCCIAFLSPNLDPDSDDYFEISSSDEDTPPPATPALALICALLGALIEQAAKSESLP